MQRAFTSFLFSTLPIATLGCLIPLTAKAQVTPDNTTSTIVNQNGNNFIIEQGNRVGDNLFHSFNEFSVPTLGSAVFNNAGDIANIFSRVTGSNISNIDGLISANGAANLFLINPNGIIFGENASLNLGGSFFASTADSLLFEGNTEFSASNPQAQPLLEVSIPIGLNFRDNPGDIVNQSRFNSGGNPIGLFLQPEESMTLLGGEIRFESGNVLAPGSRVQLGGISEAGTVRLNEDGSLGFSNDVEKADLILRDAVVDVGFLGLGTNGGDIFINARNLQLSEGSKLAAGLIQNLDDPNFRAGDININVTDTISLSGQSVINNLISRDDVGNTGDINITTGDLILTDRSFINVAHRGQQGNSGNVNIKASGLVSIDSGANSGIASFAVQQVKGNGGDIVIESASFSLSNEAQINSSTFTVGDAGKINITTDFFSQTTGGTIGSATLGQGNGGSISITANEEFSFDGIGDGLILNAVSAEGMGIANDIIINTPKLSLFNSAEISASNLGQGNGGSIQINATDLISITSGSELEALTSGEGNAGNINLNTKNGTVLFDDGTATTSVEEEGIGNAGNINVNTGSLTLTNNGQLISSTSGQGNAGSVIVNALDTVFVDGRNGNFASGILTQVSEGAVGNGGNIEITTNKLSLSNGAALNSGTGGQGIGGEIKLRSNSLSLVNNAEITSTLRLK